MIIYANLVPLETIDCYKCHVTFAVPQSLNRARLTDGENFWCPNGHGQHYTKSELQRLKEEKAKLIADLDWQKKRKEEEYAVNSRWARRYNGLLGQLARVKRKR